MACVCVHVVSMIEGELFDKLEAIARAVRKIEKPFGGIQLVVCGDFLQVLTHSPFFCSFFDIIV